MWVYIQVNIRPVHVALTTTGPRCTARDASRRPTRSLERWMFGNNCFIILFGELIVVVFERGSTRANHSWWSWKWRDMWATRLNKRYREWNREYWIIKTVNALVLDGLRFDVAVREWWVERERYMRIAVVDLDPACTLLTHILFFFITGIVRPLYRTSMGCF